MWATNFSMDGLNTYTLVLLTIFYFQKHKLLPSIHSLQKSCENPMFITRKYLLTTHTKTKLKTSFQIGKPILREKLWDNLAFIEYRKLKQKITFQISSTSMVRSFVSILAWFVRSWVGLHRKKTLSLIHSTVTSRRRWRICETTTITST